MSRRIQLPPVTLEEAHALKDGANVLWLLAHDPAQLMAFMPTDDEERVAYVRELADIAADAADRIDLAIRSSRRGWIDSALRRDAGTG